MKKFQTFQMGSLPPALLLGFDNHGLALARSLGRRGISVDVVESDHKQFHQYSRYVRRFHCIPSLEDESLLDFLVKNAGRSPGEQVLFITRDKTVSHISENRDSLPAKYVFNLPDHKTVKRLMNKEHLVEFLEELKCSSPRTAVLINAKDIPLVVQEIGLPCLVKPALRAYGFKAAIASSEEELFQTFEKASRHAERLIAQEWIPGPDQNVHFCFVYATRRGEVKEAFTGRKIRQYPKYTGIASAVEGYQNEFVRKESIRLMQLAGYKGFGSTEFKKDARSGKFQFIEFTVGRTDYDVEVAVANGVDLPFIGYSDMVGLEGSIYQGPEENRLRWVDFGRDISALKKNVRDGELGKVAFVKDVMKDLGPKTVLSFFAIEDPRPFLEYLLDRILAVFRKITRVLHFHQLRFRG